MTIAAMATKTLLTLLVTMTMPVITSAAPCLSTDFTMAIESGTNGSYLALEAMTNGTSDALFLVAAPRGIKVGTSGMHHPTLVPYST